MPRRGMGPGSGPVCKLGPHGFLGAAIPPVPEDETRVGGPEEVQREAVSTQGSC